jgi:tetratricopeptide (TPR) repeat protein
MRALRDSPPLTVPSSGRRMLPKGYIPAIAAGLALLIAAAWWLWDSARPSYEEGLVAMDEVPSLERGATDALANDSLIAPQALRRDHPSTDMTTDQVGMSLFAELMLNLDSASRGELASAKETLQLRAQVIRAASGPAHPIRSSLIQAENLLLKGELQPALKAYRQAYDRWAGDPSMPAVWHLTLRNNMALALDAAGDPLRADELYREGLVPGAEIPNALGTRYSVLLHNQAIYYHRLGHLAKAEAAYSEVRARLTSDPTAEGQLRSGLLENLARLYQDTGRETEAAKLMEEALRYSQK